MSDVANFELGNTGVVPLKGRARPNWGVDGSLTAEPLLKKEGSILGLHLTNRHLLIIHASSALNAAAAAVWIDSNTLEPVWQMALPAGVSYAWAENGLQKILVSTCLGDVYTMSAQPQVRCAETAHEQTFSITSKAMLCTGSGFHARL